MATRHRSKLRQAAERAAADIEGHSATAKFCQPRRLTRGVAEAPFRSEVNCPIDPSSLEQMRGRDRNQPVRNEKRDRYYECQQNEFDSVPSRQWMLLCALSAHKTPTSVRGRDASYLAPPAQIRTSPIRAYGLYGAFSVKRASRHFCRLCHSILLFDPRREHSFVPTAYFHRRRAQRRSRTARLQRRRRLVLDGREHGGKLAGWLAA